MSEAEKSQLNWQRQEPIAVPTGGSEGRIAVRIADWRRIKRTLTKAERSTPWLPIAYSVLFGISATAAVSIVSVLQADGLSSWVTPAYIIGAVAAFIVAVVFVIVDRGLESEGRTKTEDCIVDMRDVEATIVGADPAIKQMI